jgi:hypothetical protein
VPLLVSTSVHPSPEDDVGRGGVPPSTSPVSVILFSFLDSATASSLPSRDAGEPEPGGNVGLISTCQCMLSGWNRGKQKKTVSAFVQSFYSGFINLPIYPSGCRRICLPRKRRSLRLMYLKASVNRKCLPSAKASRAEARSSSLRH